jgi:hypothetical protein
VDDDGNMNSDDVSEYMAVGSDDVALPFPLPVPPSGNTSGYAYQIRRAPRRIGRSMELTGGTCIDLSYSGIGVAGTDFATTMTSLVVMLAPNGAVQTCYANGTQLNPAGTLHFLLGKVEKINVPLAADPTHVSGMNMFDPQMSNLADPTSLWVSIGHQNGTVVTSENVPPDQTAGGASTWTDYSVPAGAAGYLQSCRSVATGREQMEGR